MTTPNLLVADRRDHVLVTRNGRPAAVLVPVDEYDALEETAEILSDPDALAALETGLAELSAARRSLSRTSGESWPSAVPSADGWHESSSRAARDAICSNSTGR